MKYLKLFESFEDNPSKIHEICRKYNIEDYIINPDGSIDVNGGFNLNLDLYEKNLTELPLKFNISNYSFSCSYNYLTTLEGSPVEVNGDFYCSWNRLTSFQYAPKIIRGCFWCKENYIKSFEYFPSFVKGSFDCDGNPIEEVWWLFQDTTKIELLNDFDIFRDEDTDTPGIVMDRLNDFLTMIGRSEAKYVNGYINI